MNGLDNHFFLLCLQMDELAVVHSDDSLLKRLGIKTDGDIIRLKLMCKGANVDEFKSNLKEYVEMNQSRAKPKQPTVNKCKVIYISWKHYNRNQKRFNVVRAERGGGMCKMKFQMDATKDSIIEFCLSQFWEKRKKIEVNKPKASFHFFLTDGTNEVIPDVLGQENLPFTIMEYLKINKQSRIRIFFCSKEKHVFDRILNPVHLSSDDEDDFVEVPRRRQRMDVKEDIETSMTSDGETSVLGKSSRVT